MNRTQFIAFIKDHLFFTITFYSAAILLTLFFSLQTGQWVELVYPFILVTFVYLIFLLIRGYRYAAFSQLLNSLHDNPNQAYLKGLAEEQKQALNTIKQSGNKYAARLNELELENKNKNQILSQIIHHLKTPTTVIDLLVQNSKEEAPTQETLDKISKENRLINDHLNQAINYLRLDFFQNDYVIEQTDLILQLREIINRKKESFIDNQVFPQWELEDESVRVLTDRKWNSLLLEQLLSNAIKYTALQEGEKKVSIRMQKNADRVLLTITDTGIGIPEHDLKRVFEPFFTGDNGRKTRNSTGIGLHISKNIVERLNHSLKVSSEAGQGTQVTVTYLTTP